MRKMTDFVNLQLTFKQKYIEDVLQITICEHNKAVGKIRFNITTSSIEYLKIDEYSRLSMFATILLRKLFYICKTQMNIKDVNMTINKRQFYNNEDAITKLCHKFKCICEDNLETNDIITITCKL
jgi:predicted ATPase